MGRPLVTCASPFVLRCVRHQFPPIHCIKKQILNHFLKKKLSSARLEKAQRIIYVKDFFFHILVLLAIEQQCIEIFWAAGWGSRSRKCTICPFPGPPPVATTLQPLNPCQTPHQKVWAEVVKRPKNRLKNIMVACVEVIG